MTDRGQSEVLGFASLFALVMLTVLVVTATAYPGFRNVEEFQRVELVEQGMVSFADNVDDLLRNDAPSRSTRLGTEDGRLSLGPPVTVTVNGSSATGSFSESVAVRPLVYRSSGDTQLIYSNGAVLRADSDGVVMVREPRVLLSDDRVVLPIVQLRQGAGPAAVKGTTRIVTARQESRLVVAERTASTVTLTITSPRVAAWEAAMEGHDGVTCDPISGDTLTCSVSTQRVYVTVVSVDVAFR